MAVICSKLYWGYYFAPPTIDLPKYLDKIDNVLEVRYKKNDKKTEIINVTSSDISNGAAEYSRI